VPVSISCISDNAFLVPLLAAQWAGLNLHVVLKSRQALMVEDMAAAQQHLHIQPALAPFKSAAELVFLCSGDKYTHACT
jgi:hypothetical protein